MTILVSVSFPCDPFSLHAHLVTLHFAHRNCALNSSRFSGLDGSDSSCPIYLVNVRFIILIFQTEHIKYDENLQLLDTLRRINYSSFELLAVIHFA